MSKRVLTEEQKARKRERKRERYATDPEYRAKIIERSKEYAEKNREAILERDRKYRELHKAEKSEYNKRYREENKSKLIAYYRDYYQKNLAKVSAKGEAYRKKNGDKIREYQSKYRAEHSESKKVYLRRYRQDNREELKEKQKQYRDNNREYLTKKSREAYWSEPERARQLVYRYSLNDSEKGFDTSENITREWLVEHIFNSSCVYCGDSDWSHLGCDRIDNNKPHTPDNCVCSCGICNLERQEKRMTMEEFLEYRKTSPRKLDGYRTIRPYETEEINGVKVLKKKII